MPANLLWNIAWGAYALSVNRRDRTYSLTETATATVWANDLPLGFVTVTERETGIQIRHGFGDLQMVSVSEKAGATGKRILFGLNAPGNIPVDVYLTCTDREIQLTVEASRDTKTHRVERVELLPGLCAVPDDAASYLVLPRGEGAIVPARAAPTEPFALPVWDADTGLCMPFIGAVRGTSALALLTDSAYSVADLSRTGTGAGANFRYERDPERRRLDLRIALMPGGDHINIARAYRDKLISDGGHVSLRKKMRDRPALAAWLVGNEKWQGIHQIAVPSLDANANRWQTIDDFGDTMQSAEGDTARFGTFSGDWSSPHLDAWRIPSAAHHAFVPVPLLAVVYHDATQLCFDLSPHSDFYAPKKPFLRALLNAAQFDIEIINEWMAGFPMPPYTAVLRGVNRFSLGAFLVSHRFLSPDLCVEEAHYSNGLRVVINQSEITPYVTSELHLPPLGFYATHPQVVAYCAYRIGEQTMDGAAWYVRYAKDDKPLAQSADIHEEQYNFAGENRREPGTPTP